MYLLNNEFDLIDVIFIGFVYEPLDEGLEVVLAILAVGRGYFKHGLIQI
jgi:hypothetical protein